MSVGGGKNQSRSHTSARSLRERQIDFNFCSLLTHTCGAFSHQYVIFEGPDPPAVIYTNPSLQIRLASLFRKTKQQFEFISMRSAATCTISKNVRCMIMYRWQKELLRIKKEDDRRRFQIRKATCFQINFIRPVVSWKCIITAHGKSEQERG